MKLVAMKSGDEYDGLSRKTVRIHSFKPGERKRIKRLYNRQIRRELRSRDEVSLANS